MILLENRRLNHIRHPQAKRGEETQSKTFLTEATYLQISVEQYNLRDPDDVEDPWEHTEPTSHTTASASPCILLTTTHFNNNNKKTINSSLIYTA